MVLRIESVRERLAKLEEVVTRLAELARISEDEFARDYRQQWVAERGLEIAAQAVLDVGNHVLAGEFGHSATEYSGILRGLGERGVLSPVLATRLAGLGGFRNILVHGYLGIDREKVYSALQRSVRDFTDFQAEIVAWLDRRPGGPVGPAT